MNCYHDGEANASLETLKFLMIVNEVDKSINHDNFGVAVLQHL